MSPLSAPVLVADIFDRFRIQLSDEMVNWLTPVWILCLGAAAGLVLCGLIWCVLFGLSRIPLLGNLSESTIGRRVAVGVLTTLLFVGALALFPGLRRVAPAQPPPAAADAAVEKADEAAAQPARGSLDSLWLLGGCLVGCWVLALAAVTLVSRKALAESNIALREGVLFPLLIVGIVMSVLALLGLVVVRQPMTLMESLLRYPALAGGGTVITSHTVDAPPNEFDEPPEVAIPVNFRKDEIRELVIKSDQRIRMSSHSVENPSPVALVLDLPAGETGIWRRQPGITSTPFPDAVVRQVYAKNYSSSPARIDITAVSKMATPEMMLVPVMAVSMAAIFILYLFQRAAMPKLAAVALATAKSDMAQPLYAIVLAGGLFALIVFVYIPYNTFGDDIKQLKDSGLNLILVLCILQAVWAAGTSVSEEVEGKTALTVLSKPVSRRDFILGKFIGISWSTGLLCILLGLLLLVTVSYKPIYDFREGGWRSPDDINADPTWQNCFAEMIQTTPGLLLVYMEALVMAALSVAISTRLPTLANFIICFAIYVLGHLTPLIVQSQVVANQLPPVVFFGRLIATVLPVLDHFNIQASIAAGAEVPYAYLAWALVYCLLYSTVAMLLALTLFEDRDLA
jgi:ABC-type transport system involved in multi-copper enzyme maturation permease subunit